MGLLSRKDWTGYLVELAVVVFGILIAFQVDEWRDRLAENRELQAALGRLEEETAANLQSCERDVPVTARLAAGAHAVLGALHAGRLEDEDVDSFNDGLANIAFNPQPRFLATVAEEMIATGLLKDLENSELRVSIAELPTRILSLQREVSVTGEHLRSTAAELYRSIDYSYNGPTELAEFYGYMAFENGVQVAYDFDALTRNRYLLNLYVEAADINTDRYTAVRDLCAVIERIETLLKNP